MPRTSTALFDRMAADLAICRPEVHDEVLCPMCMTKVGRAEIETLTVEHIVPKRLGGEITTLTCKKPCNNDFGHQAQSHLATLLKMNESFRGRGDLRGSFTLAGHKVPIAAQVRAAGGIDIKALGGHPGTFEAIGEAVTMGPQPWSLNVKIPYNPGRASAAILRTAYLTAFHEFGYRYILAEPVDLLRREILSAMKEHSGRLCQLTGTMPGAFELNGNEPESVTVPLAFESGYEFLFVALKFQYNQRGYWTFAVLPVMTQAPKTAFEDLHRAVEVLGSHSLRMHGDESGTVTVEFVPKAS